MFTANGDDVRGCDGERRPDSVRVTRVVTARATRVPVDRDKMTNLKWKREASSGASLAQAHATKNRKARRCGTPPGCGVWPACIETAWRDLIMEPTWNHADPRRGVFPGAGMEILRY